MAWFHFHKWDRWSEPFLVQMVINGALTGRTVNFQERACLTCGKMESRRCHTPVKP